MPCIALRLALSRPSRLKSGFRSPVTGLGARPTPRNPAHEDPRRLQARGGLQRPHPGQAGRLRRGHRRRQAVAQSVRRDRAGRSPAPARQGHRHRSRRRHDRPRRRPGAPAQRPGDGRQPRHPRGQRPADPAADRRAHPAQADREGTAGPGDPRQAGDRRRRQPDRADAGHAVGPPAGDVRLASSRSPTARPR